MQRYKKLIAWQRAHALTLQIYQLTKNFPTEEKYGLISQIRRASVSVTTNIVEGNARNSNGQFSHFLNIAEGSLAEVDCLLTLAVDLGYTGDKQKMEEMERLVDEVGRLLRGLRSSVSPSSSPLPLSSGVS